MKAGTGNKTRKTVQNSSADEHRVEMNILLITDRQSFQTLGSTYSHCPHVVQPVSQFDEDHSRVVDHAQKHDT